MDFDKAKAIYRQIEATELDDLKNIFFAAAVRYARVRAEWRLADFETRRQIDSHRTALHNELIDACNILSRKMVKASENISWRASMREREEIGDFACYVHCLLGLAAR